MRKDDVNSLDSYVEYMYNDLVRYANRFAKADACDLVHHTYLKIRNAGFVFSNFPMTDFYFKRSIKTNGQHDFRKLYYVFGGDIEPFDIAEEIDESELQKVVQREILDEAVRQLPQFERIITELYLMGENMRVMAEESEIAISTVYHTLSKVREDVKNYIKNRQNNS